MKMKNLMVRTLSGLVLVAVFVGAVLGSQWSFGALLLLILVGGQTEFYKLARETGLSPQRWMGLAVGVLLFALNFIVFRQFSRSVTDEAGGAVLYLLLYIGLLLPTLFVCELFRRSATPLANLGATLLGVLYRCRCCSTFRCSPATACGVPKRCCAISSSSGPTTSSPIWWG